MALPLRAYLFLGAHIVSVYTRLCENHDIEKSTNDGDNRCWDRQIDEVVFEGDGFVMNRLIDKENWAELLHGTPGGNGKEKGPGAVCPCYIPVVTLYIHTLYTIR